MGQIIRVGMADYKICMAPDVIITLGLGSCVGICLYDPRKKLAGMAHVMLPDSRKINQNDNRAKFADTGIDDLVQMLIKNGANRAGLSAKIAGGAQMFAFNTSNEMLRIGDKNVAASKEKLQALRIPILAEDTGLNYGRTIEFHPENGELHVKRVGFDTRIL